MKHKRRIKHNTGPREFPPRLRLALILAGAALLLGALFFLFYPRAQVLNSAEVAAVESRGMLRVGLLEGAPGLSDAGEGLEADLARAIAAEIFPEDDPALRLDVVTVTEKTALPKLDLAEFDLLLARQIADPDAAAYAYSAPYYRDPVRFYCREESARLALSAQYVGAVQGSDEAALFTAFNERYGTSLQILPYGSYPDLIEGLRSGACDFIAMPETIARQMEADALPRHSTELGALEYVAITHSDTPALATLLTMLLDTYEENGRLDRLYDVHGLTPPPKEAA